MPSQTAPPAVHAELPRVLEASHATALVIGIIIGSGIFLVPSEMMRAVGSSAMVYAVWIVGGILSLFGAMTYAEISATRPRYGGEYAYLREAYGDLTGFVFMWTQVTIAKPSSIASIASGVVRVLGNFAAFHFFTQPVFPHVVWGQLAAIAFTWLITGLNILGTRRAGNTQRLLLIMKIFLVLGVVGICLFGGHGSVVNFHTSFSGARGGFSGFMVALIAALWAYDGWSDVTHTAGEIKNPSRSLPIALIAGVSVVGVLYMLTNAAIQFVLPAMAIAHADRPAVAAILTSAPPIAATIFSAVLAVGYGSTFIGSSLTGARIPFAAARDGLFFRWLAWVHPRFKTPAAALILQAVLCSILLLLINTFQGLFSLAIFSEWLFYAAVTASVFVFRKREPDAPRPYSVTGYPVVPAIFVLCAIVLLVFSIVDQPRNSGIGAVIIACGVPLYYLLKRSGVLRPAETSAPANEAP
ncbi:APC family permease [Terriglobus sp. 2YAB30_2]|uniref:APC family permease n=1 Tax=unclassified Terriglobus TaxID=2628988 RepID=UPI003F951C58